jgi:hypothetical protein
MRHVQVEKSCYKKPTIVVLWLVWKEGIYLLIAVVLVLIGLSFPIGAYIYTRIDDENKKSGKYLDKDIKTSNKNKDVKTKSLPEIKKLIGMNDIKNSKIQLLSGKRRIILSVSSPDIPLLTDDEIEVMELKLLQFALSLNDSIQFFTTPTRIETKEPAELVLKTVESADENIPEGLRQYSDKLYNSYKEIENSRGVYVLRSFCIIGTDIKDEERAKNDLRYKCNLVMSKLIGAKMRVSILNSYQIAQLFADILQRGDNILIEKLIKNGAMELYTEGIGQEIYSGKEDKKEDEYDIEREEIQKETRQK